MTDEKAPAKNFDEDYNTSYNSYSKMGAKKRIVKLLEDSEIELTPKQIAEKLHLNHNSVRVYLPQLVESNQIVTPYKGAYCSKSTHTVRFQGVKVHNIVVVAGAVVPAHFDVVEVVGSVKVRVVGGFDRQKVSIFISCDAGMDRNSCLLAMDKGFGIAKAKLGADLVDIELKTFELNRDYLGVRVDRATCVTRTGLYDMVERVYQKQDCLRHEWKISKSMSVDEFETLLHGGVTSYNMMQANFILVQEVKRLTDVTKSMNSRILEQGQTLTALVREMIKLKQKGRGEDEKS